MKKARFYIIESENTWYLCKMNHSVEFTSGDKNTLVEWAQAIGMKVLGESNGITYLN